MLHPPAWVAGSTADVSSIACGFQQQFGGSGGGCQWHHWRHPPPPRNHCTTLFSKRSAHWFHPVIRVTLGHWPHPWVMWNLSKFSTSPPGGSKKIHEIIMQTFWPALYLYFSYISVWWDTITGSEPHSGRRVSDAWWVYWGQHYPVSGLTHLWLGQHKSTHYVSPVLYQRNTFSGTTPLKVIH